MRATELNLERVTLSTFRDLAWNGPYYSRLGYEVIARTGYQPYMTVIEAAQAPFMDVSKRVFMQKPIRNR